METEFKNCKKGIEQAMQEILPGNKKRKPCIIAQMLELADEKRQLQCHVSQTANNLYQAKCNGVRHAVRSDREKLIKECCREIQKNCR